MSTEELKMVMDMLESMGGTASSGFYVWMGYKMFTSILHAAVVGTLIFAAYKVALMIRDAQCDTENLKHIRSILLPNMYGRVCDSEIRQMAKKIILLQEAEKNGD